MSRIILICAALALTACSTAPAPSTPAPSAIALTLSLTATAEGSLASTAPANGGRNFSSSGARLWAEGARLWAEGARLWAEGARLWAEGARLWAEGQYVLLPGSTAWLHQVRLDEAHALAPRAGEGVTIALLDSGVDLTHPMLQGALLPGHDLVDGDGDASEQGRDTDPTYGHGTAVAGVLRQVAPGARILPFRVLGPDGSGKAADVARAIRLAVDSGARVINLSVAAPVASEGVRAALQYAAARGVLVVAASGNDGGSQPQAPADALGGKDGLGQFGLSVTAVNLQGELPGWSNRGGEVRAPGVGLDTAYPGNRLVTASGSSFAAPVVSGALALALAQGHNARTLAARLSSGDLLDTAALLR